jgi:hypothetical protein
MVRVGHSAVLCGGIVVLFILLCSPLSLANDSSCGNNICQPDAPYSENKDNCPVDCWNSVNKIRDLGDIYISKDETESILFDMVDKYGGDSEQIGTSLQGRPIYMFLFGNPSGGKFMFDGQVHGPEDCGTVAGLDFIQWAMTNNSQEAIDIRTKNYLLFIPIINRDTVKRQNLRRNYTLDNGSILQVPFGVDLNRNFVYGWGNSGSGNPTHNAEYRGISAGSEPETQAIRYAQQKYDPQVYVNVHCGMQMLSGGGNTTISSKIISLLDQISAATPNSTTRAYYHPGYSSGCGSGGYVKADACANGASAWLLEISEWGNLPSNLSGFYERWRPQYFPVYLAMAKSIQIESEIAHNDTIINNESNPNSTTNENNNTVNNTIIPVDDSDFRNYFGIMWVGDPCENLAYAKRMGYDYVMYQDNMERCSADLKRNMHFYFEGPESDAAASSYTWYIDVTHNYTRAQIDAWSPIFVWKGNATEDTPFLDRLATGWWFSNITFRPIIDFQQQKLIDFAINRSLNKVKRLEDKSIGWLFGGWSWDVPDFKGDWWTARQDGYTGTNWMCGPIRCKGKIVSLAYWNPDGIQSGALHSGITHEYGTYPEGFATFFKQLFSATRAIYPDFKIYYQPYNIYSSYIKLIQNRSDKLEFMPPNQVIMAQESADSPTNDLLFMTDDRIYDSGLITKDYVSNDNPDNQDHDRNLAMAATAAINGGWMSFFGRWGGTDGAISYHRVYEVPDALKLIRLIPNWDNKQGVPLEDRHWNSASKIYQSTNSYADLGIIYSRHPDTEELYAVFLNQASFIQLRSNESVSEIWATDGTFAKTTRADDQFTITGQKIYLASGELGKGYVFKLEGGQTEEIVIPNETCETCAEYENETTNQTPHINDSFRKQFPRFELATNAANPGRVRDLVIKNSRVRVDFTGRTINMTKFNESAIRMGDYFIDIDSHRFPELNQPAYITFIRVLPNYVILHDGELCSFPTCSLIVYDPIIKTLNFRVSGFSNYSLNYTGTYVPTYNKQDLKAIIIDGIATLGASFVDVAELIVIGLVLLLLASLIARWKK